MYTKLTKCQRETNGWLWIKILIFLGISLSLMPRLSWYPLISQWKWQDEVSFSSRSLNLLQHSALTVIVLQERITSLLRRKKRKEDLLAVLLSHFPSWERILSFFIIVSHASLSFPNATNLKTFQWYVVRHLLLCALRTVFLSSNFHENFLLLFLENSNFLLSLIVSPR